MINILKNASYTVEFLFFYTAKIYSNFITMTKS